VPSSISAEPSYEGLRGGSQLVRVGDSWIGIGHSM
jgi:hypothetical protein